MIKCPNCGSTAQFEYRTFYKGETFGVHQSIAEYKCECGYTRKIIDSYKYMGRTIEENEGNGEND